MEIYKDGNLIAKSDEDLYVLWKTRESALGKYEDMLYYIKLSGEQMERLAAKSIVYAVGEILGYEDEQIEKDIRKAEMQE